MVIPAGTSHDTMISEKRQTQKAQSMGRRTFKSTKVSERVIQKDVTIMNRINQSIKQYIDNSILCHRHLSA